MSDNVKRVDFAAAARQRKEGGSGPHLSGTARCLHCKHEWVAVAPVGTLSLVCPSCDLARGAWYRNAGVDGDYWLCNCGSEVFAVRLAGILCMCCGVATSFEALAEAAPR